MTRSGRSYMRTGRPTRARCVPALGGVCRSFCFDSLNKSIPWLSELNCRFQRKHVSEWSLKERFFLGGSAKYSNGSANKVQNSSGNANKVFFKKPLPAIFLRMEQGAL